MSETEPDFPIENTSKAEKYERWTASNNKANAYMLVNMSKMLRTKMENVETTYDIMEKLQEMFGHKSSQASFEATKKYVNCRMAPGQHGHDHFIKMMKYFQEVELHGATADEKTQVGIILNNLARSFLMFTTNYFFNKLDYGMTQLLNELQMYEGINSGPSNGPEKKAATIRGSR
ncbi:uncharacterized protein LOC133821403 [Humulus lupulus]|uniref:uncharacterized protein LOC133821403 n=1 Tax=Humulus lupulus TaxID=3486 RepID=UPI002B40F2DD|nr:uncharacterized protein LOC133821403 [Humulus lupulus]